MSEEFRVDVDAMTNQQREIQQTNNQETGSTTQESSSRNNQANNEDGVLGSDKGLLDRLKKLENENNESGEQHNKIGRFPQMMGKNLYFMPKSFFVGPLCGYEIKHQNGCKTFEMKNEDLKVKLAAKFIKSRGKDRRAESFLDEIRMNIKDLRECFVKEVICEYNDDTLARFLFLEGCAMLEFIRSYLSNGLKELGIDDHKASVIREDLFLLKNQIPFRVLKLLLEMTMKPTDWKCDIVNFLFLNNIIAPAEELSDSEFYWNEILKINSQNKNVHLLDLLHSLIVSQDLRYDDISASEDDVSASENNEEDDNSTHTKFLNFDRERFFRNVQELKSAGIKFKPTSGLATVSFNNKCFNIKGHLKLPTLIVDEWTERKIMNLVAYEMCLDDNYKKNLYFVTSYIKLMDFLIDREQDVKELRASRVLWNRLSSDERVARLFNNLGSRCSEPPKDKYSNMRREIQTHCERKCAIWTAQVYQEHFSSPWTVVALLAAILVISLTAVQSWFAVDLKKS